MKHTYKKEPSPVAAAEDSKTLIQRITSMVPEHEAFIKLILVDAVAVILVLIAPFLV